MRGAAARGGAEDQPAAARRIARHPLVSRALLLRPRGSLPFPFGAPGVSYWYGGRTAIYQGVGRLGLEAGARVLVPAYACGSEVDALLKAGVTPDYYHVRPDLSPDLDHLEALLAEPARALFVTHYFGFAQPIRALADFAKSRGLLLIEDAAHALYSTDAAGAPLGSFGDIAIFSLVKKLPLPDGGVLVRRDGANGRAGQAPELFRVAGKAKALVEDVLAARFPRAAPALRRYVTKPLTRQVKKRVYPEDFGPPASAAWSGQGDLKAARAGWRMSALSAFILRHADHGRVRAGRRRQYAAIADRFEGGARVRPLMGPLSEGCCPWFYPVWAEDAEGLERFLEAKGVPAGRFWPWLHPVMRGPLESFPFAASLRRHVVVLPVHQDLDEADGAWMAEALDQWNAGGG